MPYYLTLWLCIGPVLGTFRAASTVSHIFSSFVLVMSTVDKLCLQAANMTLKTEDYTVRVPRSQRGGEIVEPLVREQWFVRMQPLAQPALQVSPPLFCTHIMSTYWHNCYMPSHLPYCCVHIYSWYIYHIVLSSKDSHAEHLLLTVWNALRFYPEQNLFDAE